MNRDQKNIVATVFLKNGKAVKGFYDDTPINSSIFHLASLYNDNGVDKIIVFDLSKDEEEREKNLKVMRDLNRNVELKVCAGGNINRLDDIKKLFHSGCLQVILNGSKPDTIALAKEASRRYGRERILVSVENVDFIFKHREYMDQNFHELLVLNEGILDALDNLTNVPYVVYFDECNYDDILKVLKRSNARGIAGLFLNDPKTDIMELKSQFSLNGIKMDNYEPELKWSDLKKNNDDMVPVIVQDYHTDQVLMLAYMNEEAFLTTLNIGKMTYYSRSRHELWIKGLTSGHFQYVKSLTADCDYDTILARVSQVGAACHTGSRSCFFNHIIQKEYTEKSAQHIFEDIFKQINERRKNPREGSYANYIFDLGLDGILKKFGEDAMEVIIAAKNPESDEIKNSIADHIYHLMLLMSARGISWNDIAHKLDQS